MNTYKTNLLKARRAWKKEKSMENFKMLMTAKKNLAIIRRSKRVKVA